MPLTDLAIRAAKPGEKDRKMADAHGLYILIKPNGGKYWRLDFRIGGRRRTLALGVYPDVGLKEAREARDTARRQIRQGIDPCALKQAQKLAQSGADTFEVIAREWHRRMAPRWAPKHAAVVLRQLEKDVIPYLGRYTAESIKPGEILRVLRRIESRGAIDTAHRTKQTIGQVMRYAVATARADRDPTADLRGALAPPPRTHFAATADPAEVGRILRQIAHYPGSPIVRAALNLAPLVFVRPGELCSMRWADIDFAAAEWRYVASKTSVEHIVPLSHQALAILEDIRPLTGRSPFVFTNHRRPSDHLTTNAITCGLRGAGITADELQVHGWRAVARTLLDEQLGFAPHLIEHQLAHAVRDPMGRSYNRTAHLPERRAMMQQWADYLDSLRNPSNVVSFRSAAKEGGVK